MFVRNALYIMLGSKGGQLTGWPSVNYIGSGQLVARAFPLFPGTLVGAETLKVDS